MQGFDASNASLAMLGCAIVTGGCLVGGVLNTDAIRGVRFVLDVDGTPYECAHQILYRIGYSYSCVIEIAAYVVGAISMVAFVCCSRVKRS